MPAYSVELGKGWREPCYPYRSGMVFGAELNTPVIPVLNCNPEIVDPVTVLDLSQLESSHEVILCLVTVTGVPSGSYGGSIRWYRESDNRLLYEFVLPILSVTAGLLYYYSYIGYIPGEITQDGNYRCDVQVMGPYAFTATARFSVTGTAEPRPPPEPVGTGFMGLVTALQQVSSWCYSIYLEVLDWVWPFWLLAEPFFQLSNLFQQAAAAIIPVVFWAQDISDQLTNLLSWEGIKSQILTWLPDLENVVTWFASWVQNIRSTIADWWLGVQETVRGWIAVATEGLAELLSNWTFFASNILPNLVDWSLLTNWWTARILDVQNLIATGFVIRESLWAGWSSARDQVFEFLGNPVGYIWERFADWFFGGRE